MHGLQKQANATGQPTSAAPIQHLRLLCTSTSGEEDIELKKFCPACEKRGTKRRSERKEKGQAR
jgi:hypothetical protein